MQTHEALAPPSLGRTAARHWFPAAVAVVLLPVVLWTAATRPLWLDEILTYHVLKGGNLGDLWHRLATGSQSDPPLFYFAARASTALFGDNPAAFRLPSLLGILLLGVSVYAFVARRCSLGYARFALLLALLPPVLEHSYNARPYGLWLGFSGLALLCWQIAGDTTGVKRWAALLGLAVCAAASVATHYYAVLFLAVVGAAEAFRTWRTRRVDVAIWPALATAILPLIVCRPLIANARTFIAGSWAAPSLDNPDHGLLVVLRNLFADRPHVAVFAATALVVLPYLAWRLTRRGAGPAPQDGPQAHHLAAGAAVAALPFLGFALAALYTNNYDLRYVLPAVCGTAVLVPMAACRLSGSRPLPGHLLAALTAVLAVYVYADRLAWEPSRTQGVRVWPAVREADERARAAGTYLVTSRLHTYVETKFYHPEVRLLYVCLESHPSMNVVARRLRPWYDGILEPEQLDDLGPYLVVGNHTVSGLRLVERVETGQVARAPQAPLATGDPIYLVRGHRGESPEPNATDPGDPAAGR
jgi:hypothetical protein